VEYQPQATGYVSGKNEKSEPDVWQIARHEIIALPDNKNYRKLKIKALKQSLEKYEPVKRMLSERAKKEK
jgi:hypothetical protein